MAAETVAAAAEFGREITVGTVVAVAAEEAFVTVARADALITKLAANHAQAITTVFAVVEAARVVAVFILLRLGNQVAVFGFTAAVRVLAVLVHLRINERTEVWHDVAELLELLMEGLREIKCTSVVLRIPLVAHPLRNVVDGEWRLRRVHRNH